MSEETVAQVTPRSDPAFKLFGRTIPVLSSEDTDDSETSEVTKVSSNSVPRIVKMEDKSCSDDDEKPRNVKTKMEEEEKGSCSVTAGDEAPKKPNKVLPCPRCESTDTKFCYYNNYNVNQPRHFCRNCQRYWTAGGLLRNVPVGSGRRKNKHPGMIRTLCSDGRVFVPQDCPSEDSVKLEGPLAGFGPKSSTCFEKGTEVLWNSSCMQERTSEKRDADCFDEKFVKSEALKDHSRPENQCNSVAEFPHGWGNSGISQMWPCYGFYGSLPYPPVLGPEASSNYPGLLKSSGFVAPNPWFQPAFPWPVPPAPLWGPGWGMMPLIPPINPNPDSTSSVLGKRGREDSDSRPRNDGSLWVPKTLRIDDPEEAAKSSIWATLGLDGKADSISSGGIFKAFQPKCQEDHSNPQSIKNAEVLSANPAANSRSASFNESR